jgi:hypothetical protein
MLLKYQIGVNENIIWSGTKDVKVSVMEAIFNPLLPFALIWFILDFFIISRAAMNGAILLFFLVHLMPVWLYLFGVLTASLKARHTEYVITNKTIYSDTMYPNGLRPMQNPGYNTQYNQFYR